MRIPTLLTALLLAACAENLPVQVSTGDARLAEAPAVSAKGDGAAFPAILSLPLGWKPEGIATGRGTSFYVGSFSGAIYRGDLRTGAGGTLVPPNPARTAVGLAFDARSNLLYVAGGGLGTAYVYDAGTGETVAAYTLTAPGTFINDVIVTREAAYFTDSFRPVLYRIPLGPAGTVSPSAVPQEIPLTGDYAQVPGFNANGIEATPDGRHLLLVQSASGTLYRVDAASGEATRIDLGGAAVTSGDGLLLAGRDLYVVRNFLNQIAVVRLAPDLGSGRIVRTITDPAFRIPTTVAGFGDALYAVNARFDVAPPANPSPGVEFEVVRVPR